MSHPTPLSVRETIQALQANHGTIYGTVNSAGSIISNLPEGSEFAGLLPLNDEQVERAKKLHGNNIISFGNEQVWYKVLFHALIHPFNILLIILALATFLTEDDLDGVIIMLIMVFVSTTLRFWQEWKSASAAKSLKSMVSTLITVTRLYSCPEHRDPTPQDAERVMNHATIRMDIPIEDVVPGDWVQLSAGDLIPADVKIIDSKDLFVSQAALTGEAMPVEKFSAHSEAMAAFDANKNNYYEDMVNSTAPHGSSSIVIEKNVHRSAQIKTEVPALVPAPSSALKDSVMRPIFACLGIRRFDPVTAAHHGHNVDLSYPDRCYMGTSVVSGTATVFVEKIGSETFFGSMAKELSKRRPESAFQMGVRNISWLFFAIMGCMIPPVLLINGLLQKDWRASVLFALSVAVGLTPEMLPMIVNSNLARGAYLMSKKRCIVKNLDSIINLGSMDVLCTDKTGTLTDNKVVLVRHLDYHGKSSIHTLQLAFLNSRFQTGLKNLLDVAVVEYFERSAAYESFSNDKQVGSGLTPAALAFSSRYLKLDEIPFDFVRRRMSVVFENNDDGQAMLVSKGAVDEMLRICTKIVIPGSQDGIQELSVDDDVHGIDVLKQ
ncbi:hypothetical protein BGZ72_000349, partial [Mortierella alpina]